MNNPIKTLIAQVSVKSCEEFVRLIPYLNAFEFMGLAKILSVPIVKDEQNISGDTNPRDIESREFEDILDDVIDTFCGLRRQRRREILRMLRQAHKEHLNEVSGDAGNQSTEPET